MTRTSPDIVFIHPSDELYGADRMLLEMVDALEPRVKQGLRVEVWLPTDQAHPEDALCELLVARGTNVRHLDLPVLRRAYFSLPGIGRLGIHMSSLIGELRRVRPATVYCTTSAAFLGAPAARVAGVNRVIGHLQEVWTPSDRRVLAPLASTCHQLLAISQASADSLPDRLRLRTTVVANSTPDPGTVVPLDDHCGPLEFIIASRWNGWKGHSTLLSAWDLAGAPGRLTILGGPPDIGQSVDVHSLVSQLRSPDSVRLVGQVRAVDEYLNAADVAIMPSDDPEPFGLVAIEAFARGRPVVASDAGGLSDIVTNGHDGWLFPARDVLALAEILGSLTRVEVQAAGARARATYEARYTSASHAQRWTSALGCEAAA